jgi:ribonuclease P protein component
LPAAGFNKQERLVTQTDFQTVFAKPQRTGSKNLLALWQVNHFSHARIGIITSKRVARLAVTRNRIRRILRESFRHTKHSLGAIDIVLLTRQSCASLSSLELRKEADSLWKRVSTSAAKYRST